ncbi:Cytoplasmic chaperone TorD family protein [Thiomonas sp. X19]|uniref:TorD/DmsD family molecular chaperone n=1 Tax=Thiomonas sp. X19 TaxID=1050370 RepID=UPI000B6D2936|nr:molecular chaperone TorD family protein [Thiomonas sp. X19]SCC95783.1 Cytoplasmic chaperone TorD family protein [Thiomonas sp. X19]
MSASKQTEHHDVELVEPGSSEDAERADLWGLLALLFIAPPQQDVLSQLHGMLVDTEMENSTLQSAWCQLLRTAAATTPAQVRDEFETLFGGTGRPAVYVYGSFYLAGALHEKPLARLRADLQELGLTRRIDLGETEDHFAILAETMRFLINGDDPAVCTLSRQRDLFQRHIHPWGAQMCVTIEGDPSAHFYRALSVFTREFLKVEQMAFDMFDY